MISATRKYGLFFALCLALSLVAGGLFLKSGVQVAAFTVGPVALSNISLKWQSKLELQVEGLDISLSGDERAKQPLDLSLVDRIVPLFQWIDRLFSTISIEKIRVDEISGDLLYESSLCTLNFFSSLFDGRAILKLEEGKLDIEIKELRSGQYHSQASGKFQFDLQEKSGSGQGTAMIAGSLPVILDFTLDEKQLSFQGRENGIITTITPFVDLFGLSKDIQQWITDYLTGSRYELKTFKGNFPWDNPLHLLESFYAEVRVEGGEYTFASGLEAIKSDYTNVIFEKGVLVIRPHDATFYGQDTEDSWLDINFNDPSNILLTAHILTHAQANQDIVNLLKYYDILLPFMQTEGKTAADLILTVNLDNESVTAHGTFKVDEGRVDYCQKSYEVKKGVIELTDTLVTLRQLNVSFAELFTADVTGVFDAEKQTGDFDISLQDASVFIGKSLLVLDEKVASPSFHYTMRPDGSRITGSASSWKLDVLPLQLGEFSTSFSLEELSGELEPAMISIPPGRSAKISGRFSINDQTVDLQANRLKYHFNNLQLIKYDGPLTIQYNDGLLVRSEGKSEWILHTVPIILSPSELLFSENNYSINTTTISYGNVFESSISGQYNQTSRQGLFYLEGLDIQNENGGHFLTPSDTVSLQVDGEGGRLLLRSPELAVEFRSSGYGPDVGKSWSLMFNDLSATYKYSPLLQKYMVDSGSFVVASGDGGELYSFFADIPYRYALLVKDGKPLNRYTLYGQVGDHGVSATLNKDVHLLYKEKLSISANDVFFNIPEIVQLLKDISQFADKDSIVRDELHCTLEARGGGLILTPDRMVLSDQLTLEYLAGSTKVHIEHGAGTVALTIEGENFSLTGENLNDTFMAALTPGSEFEEGTLDVVAKGTYDEYSVALKMKDTVMKNFVTLNNILAMINTIPALITFNLPSYSLHGLSVDSFVAGMSVKNGLGTVDSLNIESPEISITGSGWIDFVKKQIGMDLNLITRAKKNISKIPLVGYILVGKKKHPSITVKVSGDLDNPDVEHSTFKEVATTPFAMFFRTLGLPAHLLNPLFSSAEDVDTQEERNGGEESSQDFELME